ncbi:MAG: PDZ domain-containing protein [Candidatus Marinimicrobia bacterium]|nr:PDZ domain-containing protein [Candidatus Neomarinimicrobiota bacterium]
MPEVTTLAQAVRNAGYQAYGVGKLHISPQRARIGFDDVILEVNGRPVNNVQDFFNAVEEDLLRAGDAITLVVWRKGRTQKVTMILGA